MNKNADMKRIVVFAASVLCLTGCATLSNINWNTAELQNAAVSALTAASINDNQIIELSKKTIAEMDASNTIDYGKYKERLDTLTDQITDINGLPLNFKVYRTNEVNAFACGDGSIRVYSGLMDVMDDDELIAIIGHECGHVAHQDTKKAMRNAYLAAAARGLVNSVDGVVGTLSQSVLGDVGESFANSQFSQKQEYKADDYGFEFAIKNGYDKYSMYKALSKLVELSGSSQASLVQKMFSSHPGSAERAARVKERADKINTNAN